jgi:hypothetical protein
MLSKVLKFIRDRLKEPSTYAALAPLVAALGWSIDGPTLATIGGGIVALLGVFIPEGQS